MGSRIILLALSLFFLVTCSMFKNDKSMGTDAEKKKPKGPPAKTTSIETKQVASEAESNYVTEINFAKGQTGLPAGARTEIKNLYKRASTKGQVAQVKLLTWADEDYPTKEEKELSSKQLKLVEDRNDNLEAYIEKLDSKLDVDKISMAERPGVMEGLLSTEDVRLKKSLETAEIPQDGENSKSVSQASKTILMFMLKESKE